MYLREHGAYDPIRRKSKQGNGRESKGQGSHERRITGDQKIWEEVGSRVAHWSEHETEMIR